MWTRFKQWLDDSARERAAHRAWRKLELRQAQYNAGRDWAARVIASGEMSAQEISNRCDEPFEGPHPFDKGASEVAHNFLQIIGE